MNFLRSTIRNFDKFPKIITSRTVTTNLQTETQLSDVPDKLFKIVELELRGNDSAVLNSFAKFATMTGNNFNIECKTWNLRKPLHDRYTVLKSAHIHKKHRVQYEIRTYFTFVQYKYLTGSTADTLLEYIERNLPEGVALKATKVELQKIPDHFQPPNQEK
ncbi:small ribosomal subunit protein uS10m [Onthophagus taurus]|uniref:small ribosomal subunit protein uS10m n=1 Tax=Onthophagus taurus TaxID=166361 RepID=UPI0039BDCFE7